MGAALAAVLSTVLVGIGVSSASGVETTPVPRAVPVVSQAEQAPEPPAGTTGAAPTGEPRPPRPSAPAAAVVPTPEPSPEPTPEPTAERTASPQASIPVRAAAQPQLVPGTPCTATARACVDLDARRAWLIKDGAVTRTAQSMMIGDEIDPTPRGTFQVEWKAEQWTSREYLTQMPYAVFFADGGIAFHEGPQDTNSAGCVKLLHEDAVAWFDYLQVGDEVQIR
jgi:lipoprotein-anchoring transpeptidase ErfK/SrfK